MSKKKEGNEGGEAPTLSELLEGKTLEEVLAANKEFKAEYDRKVSKGIETYKAAHPPKQEEKPEEKGQEGKSEKKEGSDEIPAWAKAMQEQNQKLLDAMEANKKAGLASELLKSSEALKNVPAPLLKSYEARLSSADADKQAEVLQELEEEAKEIAKAYGKPEKGLPTGGSGGDKKVTEEEVKRIMSYN